MVTRKRKKENSAFQNILVAALFLFIFGGGVGFLTYQNIKINQKRGGLEEKLQSLQAQAEQFSTRKAELERQIGEIESEEYQEKLLREQGLYKKEGEEVVTVLLPEVASVEFEEAAGQERVWWNPLTWFRAN